MYIIITYKGEYWKEKKHLYNKFQEVANLFKEKCGSIYWRDLKNMQKNKVLSCEACVQVADEILTMMIKSNTNRNGNGILNWLVVVKEN